MKLFSVSIQARRFGAGESILIPMAVTVSHVSAVVAAESKAEAKELALEAAEEVFPRLDGWHGHNFGVMEVVSDLLAKAARPIEE